LSSCLERLRSRGPQRPPDLDRILALPHETGYPKCCREAARAFFKGKTIQLRDIQCDSFLSMAQYRGLFGPIGVGHGKTIISLLAGRATRAERTMLVIPPNLCQKCVMGDIPMIAEEFGIDLSYLSLHGMPSWDRLNLDRHYEIFIVPYSLLSVQDTYNILDQIHPDLIVADECHMLKRPQSARTKRLMAYLTANQSCNLVAMSGTVTKKNLFDYRHLIDRALRQRSPLPRPYSILNEWNEFIGIHQQDEHGEALTEAQRASIRPVVEWAWPRENIQHIGRTVARMAFRERLRSAPGVVQTDDQSVDCSLIINNGWGSPAPTEVIEAISNLERTWTDPNGDEINEIIRFVAAGSQLSSGFYYRLDWPEDVEDWVLEQHDLKQEFYREMRRWLSRGLRKGYDTPMLAINGLKRGDPATRPLRDSYYAWQEAIQGEVPDRIQSTCWISEFKADNVANWLAEVGKPGIVWYRWKAVGEMLREKFPELLFCPAGCDFENFEKPDRALLCSLAHATGKNLQKYSRQLIVEPMRSGEQWEQLLGRTHRQGQEADEVVADVDCCTDIDVVKLYEAYHDCKYVEHTGGGAQKMLMADFTIPLAREMNTFQDMLDSMVALAK